MHDNISQYVGKHQLKIGKRLGFGIHGTVFSASGRRRGITAVKMHYERENFLRELDVYQRLDENGVREVNGFNVPELLVADEDLLILEMTIVVRPFLLDFAGAYVDVRPHFSEEIIAEWEAQKIDQFGEKWPIVRKVLDALEELDIFYIDVSPTNISFRD